MKKKYFLLLIFGISCIQYICAVQEAKLSFYRADSPTITYVGRTLTDDRGAVSFDWSGTYLTTVFTGGYLAMRVSDTKLSYYNVFVDGKPSGVIKVTGKDTLITIISGIDKGKHHLRLQKRTEGEQGLTTIHAFGVGENEKLFADTNKRKKHILFIGDSLTTGYGSEGLDKEEPFTVETQNCDITYACIISRYFSSDYTLIAHSGRGVVRNYGDSLRVSKYAMSDRMMNTFDTNQDIKWDFKDAEPDLVVINVGSNDFSTKPYPLKEEFTSGYLKMIEQIRHNYTNAKIICVGPRIGEPAFSYIKELCEKLEDSKIYFRGSLNGVYNYTSDLGAAWHPNYNGNRKIAMSLIPYIATVMDWSLSDSFPP